MKHYARVESPIGDLLLVSNGSGLTRVELAPQRIPRAEIESGTVNDEILVETGRQLAQYFAGARSEFDLPLAPAGTPFQLRVWTALREIPYGQTESYGGLARRLGSPGGSRAVGLANGRNPLPIIVPCHRVIGSDGSLTGYGGGIERKRWLLAHEREHLAPGGTAAQDTLLESA